MAARIEAFVKPELLVWARETRGFSTEQAAKKLGIKPDRLEQWENGERKPTISQLRKATNVYKRPLAVFFLAKPPEARETLPDFRRLTDKSRKDWSPELRLAVREALERRDVILELSRDLQERSTTLPISLSLSDSPEDVSSKVRDLLKLPTGPRFGQATQPQLFSALRIAIEELGVLVFQAPKVSVTEMRAASITESVLPVVLVNSRDAVGGRIFSMLHELAHVLLRKGGLCDFEGSPASRRIEVFCNHVSGAALVPRDDLLADPIVRQRGSGSGPTAWTNEDLSKLAARYLVSQEVILRRLTILGRASPSFYERKREEFLRQYAKKRTVGGFAPPDVLAVSRLGLRYVKTVLEAYRRELITANETSDFLGVKLNQVERVERTASQRSAIA